jgi:hypothetical protein
VRSDEPLDIISLAQLKDTEEFTIDEQFKGLLFTMSPENFANFEKQILDEGCRSFLTIWEEEKILIDGHHRLAVCQKHDLTYGIEELSFENRGQVVVPFLS